MKGILGAVLSIWVLGCSGGTETAPKQTPAEPRAHSVEGGGKFTSLFDGKSLEGWTASENPETFRVEDGLIVVHGPRAHLFYTGPFANHDFRNFELEAEIMTTPGLNSGIFFHTEFNDEGWPSRGYEAQVNNSHTDWRVTGSLYAIEDVAETKARDHEWFTESVMVRGKRITIQVNGETVVDYVEPDEPQRPEGREGRTLSSGTVALQGHDPESKVFYRAIRIRLFD